MALDEILKHVSAEIHDELVHAAAMRDKLALTAWLGPFVVVGALLAATDGRLPEFSLKALFWLGLAAVTYLAMGAVSGLIEKRSWQRVNELRVILLRIYAAPEVKPAADALEHLMPGPNSGMRKRPTVRALVGHVSTHVSMYALALLSLFFLLQAFYSTVPVPPPS